MPAKEHRGLEPVARVRPHELLQRRVAVAGQDRKPLVRYAENVAVRLPRPPVVEDACFEWPRVKLLNENRARLLPKVRTCVIQRMHETDPDAALSRVRLQHDGKVVQAELD